MRATVSFLEASLFRSYWDDGLLDLLCGVGLLAIGLGWWFDLPVFAAVAPPLLVPLWQPLRRLVVEPRAGYVQFSRARQRRTTGWLQLAFAAGGGSFVLGVVAYVALQGRGGPPNLVRIVPGLPAALLALGAFIAASLTAAPRFRAYGLLLLAGAAGTILLELHPSAPMLLSGPVVLLVGGAFLGRFLREAAAHAREES